MGLITKRLDRALRNTIEQVEIELPHVRHIPLNHNATTTKSTGVTELLKSTLTLTGIAAGK